MGEGPRTVLITGAGLVAAHAAGALHRLGVPVVLYDLAPSREYLDTVIRRDRDDGERGDIAVVRGDVTDVARLAVLIKEHGVGCIFHTAGLIGARVSRQPFRGVEVNVTGSMAVIEAARQSGVTRVVFCSSMAVYDFAKLPERVLITEDAPLGSQNLYGATKLASEHLLDQFGKLHGIGIVHLRLAGVFGRGQFTGGSWMGRILNRLLCKSLSHEPVAVQPEWIGTNEFIYVKDVAAAAAAACLLDENLSGPFNIGTGVLHSVDQVVAEIQRLLPAAAISVLEPETALVSYLQRTQAFDISRARTRLGFEPRFSLAAGLGDYIAELRAFADQYTTLE
jgi:nucleoside-diphosphate-sugar epimerase